MPSGKSSILVDDEGQFSNAAAKGLANKTTSAIVKQEKKERPGLLLSLSICCTLQLLQQPPSHCGRIQIFVQKFNFHGISCNFEF